MAYLAVLIRLYLFPPWNGLVRNSSADTEEYPHPTKEVRNSNLGRARGSPSDERRERFEHGTGKRVFQPDERRERFEQGAGKRVFQTDEKRERFEHGTGKRVFPPDEKRERFEHRAGKRVSPPDERLERFEHRAWNSLPTR